MIGDWRFPVSYSLAQAGTTFTVRELDWPTTPLGWFLFLGGTALMTAWVIWLYRRDTAELAVGWKIWLTLLRLATLAGVFIIALNPHERTQRDAFRPSRVAVLVDTSLSMRHPAESAAAGASSAATERFSRSDAAIKVLGGSNLLATLNQDHEISLFTFDSSLSGPHRVFSVASNDASTKSSSEPQSSLDWNELLQPRGLESRLGESLAELIRQSAGTTLSGIVVISDGASNAGLDAPLAGERAAAAKARLVTIGVGGTELPVNVAISDIQTPTEVQKGDNYDITAFLQGQGLSGQSVDVELLLRGEGEDAPPSVVDRQQVTLPEDGVPVEVKFSRTPDQMGKLQYTVRVQPANRTVEFDEQDNTLTFSVNVFDRPTRALLIAGGPMRDYQFVRNLLYRHKSFDVDVYLQTAGVGTSQESHHLLLSFPATREELYQYDVLIAFDPDWELLPEGAPELINDWVANEAGGMILVAGDVYTPQFAMLDGPLTAGSKPDRFQKLKELYPVVLSSYFAAARNDSEAGQPWPIEFTPDGKAAGFLQLTDDPVTSAARWKEFPGMYRCYPTADAKAGATVFARFSDPRAAGEVPILMAAQFYGQGRSFYLGSAEMWRLRSTSDEDYDRFWIKTIREVSQGRLKRGAKHGVLIPESRRVSLGQTVRIRARLLDGQFQPLDVPSVGLEVYDPSGKPIVPRRLLMKDAARAGEFVGDFRANLPGVYRLQLSIPDTREEITDEITVLLPKLEDENVRQNVQLLTQLAEMTAGAYLPIQEAESRLPALLPARGEPFTVDQRLHTLWDRPWVLYLLVGLLSLEWLSRKLLKLA